MVYTNAVRSYDIIAKCPFDLLLESRWFGLSREEKLNSNLGSSFKKWAIPGPLFLYFRLLKVQYKMLPMTGFKLGTSGIGTNRSTN